MDLLFFIPRLGISDNYYFYVKKKKHILKRVSENTSKISKYRPIFFNSYHPNVKCGWLGLLIPGVDELCVGTLREER